MPMAKRPTAPARTAHEKDKAAFLADAARCRVLPWAQQLDIAACTGGKLLWVIQHAIDQSNDGHSTVDLNQELNGSTLLQQASSNRQLEVLELLLLNGADPNLVARVSTLDSRDDEPGWAPLINAITFLDLAAVDLLLEHGANPNITSDDGNNVFWHLCQKLDLADKEQMTAITTITERLLEAGFDTEASQLGAESAIEIVARVAPDTPLAEMIEDGRIAPEKREAGALAIREAKAEEERQRAAANALIVERIASSGVMPVTGEWYGHHGLRSPSPTSCVGAGESCGGFLPKY
eukprot:TRINITY_DN16880_c0_g1_i1.p1 TRINITY_DN16880_c0_g1~~TRINITY_DN16880_c0_g1_i1.p1  ORF type:complete len:293 (+),score=57.63 TRINITY_DN16880_c0_g1_i1:118-996(+)